VRLGYNAMTRLDTFEREEGRRGGGGGEGGGGRERGIRGGEEGKRRGREEGKGGGGEGEEGRGLKGWYGVGRIWYGGKRRVSECSIGSSAIWARRVRSAGRAGRSWIQGFSAWSAVGLECSRRVSAS